ncbi:MAG: carbonic anhydrase [Vicinamibacterales bacterium]
MNAFSWSALGVAVRLAALAAAAGWSVLSAAAQAPTPALALGQLKAGNDRFVKNVSQPVALGAPARQAAADAAPPVAMVLSCADARVPPEFVFNTALGELFVVRSLGGVADRAAIASLEHGAASLHAPVLVVMGHEACDIVREATTAAEPAGANRQFLIKAIRAGTERMTGDQPDARAAVLAVVEQVINDVLSGSELLRQAAGTGRLLVVGAYYEMASGRVVFSEPVTTAAPSARH